MLIDLTDMKFDRLTAKELIRVEKKKGAIWRCECSCGGEKEVPASYLRKGHTKSCGCLNRERREDKVLTSRKWGSLEAVGFSHYGLKNDGKRHAYWLFRCDCGNEKIIAASDVKFSGTRSCGCKTKAHIENLNKQDIKDVPFGRLTPVRPTDDRDATGSIIWECRCECGNTVYYSVNRLRSGRTNSCGCLYRESRSRCGGPRTDETLITMLVNAKNPNSANTSGYTGVSYDRNSDLWHAYINLKRVRYNLGYFKLKQSAIDARLKAEKALHDPIIFKNWSTLTDESKKEFIDYLVSSVGMNDEQIQDKLMEFNTQNGTSGED